MNSSKNTVILEYEKFGPFLKSGEEIEYIPSCTVC